MAASDDAVLVNPLGYDPAQHGPPYLPGAAGGRVASMKVATKALVAGEAEIIQAEMSQAFHEGLAVFQGVPAAGLALLLAALRAEAMIHQSHHWATHGPLYYADHLLFDRIYSDVFDMVDGLAERLVGSSDPAIVSAPLQVGMITRFTGIFYGNVSVPPPEAMPLLSLQTVLRFLALLNQTYAHMEQSNTLTHGTDNLLQGIADQHETLIYLLKQRTSNVRVASQTVPQNATAWKR